MQQVRRCPRTTRARRNEPNVDGANEPAKTRPIPPCRNNPMSSIESAPATIPATSDDTFNPACAPLSVGTVSCRCASCAKPAASASPSTGTNPAADTRFGSSNAADIPARV